MDVIDCSFIINFITTNERTPCGPWLLGALGHLRTFVSVGNLALYVMGLRLGLCYSFKTSLSVFNGMNIQYCEMSSTFINKIRTSWWPRGKAMHYLEHCVPGSNPTLSLSMCSLFISLTTVYTINKRLKRKRILKTSKQATSCLVLTKPVT